MPRTRLTRRQPEPSQEPAEDDTEIQAEDETSAPVPKRKGKAKVKSELKNKSRNADEGDEGDIADEDVEVPIFDPSTFADQPLMKDDAIRLQGFSNDWANMADLIKKNTYALITDVSRAVIELVNEEDREKYINEDLEPLIREVIQMENRVSAEKEAIDALRQRVLRGNEITDPHDDIDKFVNATSTRWEQSTSRQKYSKHGKYLEYRSAIWDAANEDTPMPPITDFIPREDGDPVEDDEVEVGGVTQDYRCPLTLMVLENPMTSIHCKHSFDKDTIIEYLRNGPKQCPATGCSQELSIDGLEEDEDLGKKAKAYKKRVARREAEEEEDVDELSEAD